MEVNLGRSTIKELEKTDMDLFIRLMDRGTTLTKCAESGDIEGFKEAFEEAKEFGALIYWHA